MGEKQAFELINKMINSANKIEDFRETDKKLTDDIETLSQELKSSKYQQEENKKKLIHEINVFEKI